MKFVEDAYCKCPFYSKESNCSIVCEGLYSGTNNRITFNESKVDFKERFCRNKYNDCRLYKALMLKYL